VSFTAPSRPGVYYITQQSSWWFFCYQFGHLFHDQISNDAIAVIFVDPHGGVTANTTATDASPEGNYPIIVGGCYFNPNYRIIFKDDSLTVLPGLTNARLQRETNTEISRNGSRIYPNPASTFVRLQLKDDLQPISGLQVYDGVGKMTMTSYRRLGEGFYEIDVSRLPPGVYAIKALTAYGIQTFRFIKK
jgi:hypothetical protein